jgi:UDP-N-acetylmuramoyl-tripeptide--D-alanyl-D-alanine ligase
MDITDKLSWEELIAGISGRRLQGDLNSRISGISTDTRTLQKGSLFVALNGPTFNGHDYLARAFEKGAVAALVSEPLKPGEVAAHRTIIQVKDTLWALGDLSALWRRQFSVTLIGISGSNGKTTSKEMLAGILEQEGPTLKNPGNLNNWIGLPLSLFSLKEDHRYAVMEMGMNRAGEIARLCRIARPSAGLLTNIGPAHLEGLGSMEAVAKAKGELFEALEGDQWALVNSDDFRIRDLAQACRARKLTFGLNAEAEVKADHLSLTPQGIRFRIRFDGDQEEMFLPVQGRHNVSNALGAAAVALALGLSLNKIQQGLGGFKPADHRLQIKKGLNGIRLIDDTYNANPASVKAALAVFDSLRQDNRGGLILGDMLELGDGAVRAHQEIGRLIGDMGVDYLITLGPLSRELLTEALKGLRPPRKTFGALSPGEIMDSLKDLLQEGEVLLIKGSHGMKMEALVKALEDQG